MTCCTSFLSGNVVAHIAEGYKGYSDCEKRLYFYLYVPMQLMNREDVIFLRSNKVASPVVSDGLA